MYVHWHFEPNIVVLTLPCALFWNRLQGKTQRAKVSDNFSKESNLPRTFRRYPEILENPVKVK